MQHWPNNRPTRSQIRRLRSSLVALMLLAWATQLLLTQWAHGADEVERGIQLHMRDSAHITTSRVRLADVCDVAFAGPELTLSEGRPVGQLVVLELQEGQDRIHLGVEQVVDALIEAGIHPGQIRFQGPVRCEVRLVDEAAGQAEQALLEWAGVGSDPTGAPPAGATSHPERQALASAEAMPPVPTPPGAMTLGEMLRLDLGRQLQLSPEALLLAFRPEDEAVARRTDIAPNQVRHLQAGDLGWVNWSVAIDGREVPLQAQASAVVSRARLISPVSRGQVIRQTDVSVEQVRITRLAERGLTPAEAIGQEAVGTLPAGELLTSDVLAPRLLVRRGQFIAVRLIRDGVELRSLGRALDDGAYGQVVRVKNETTGEVLQVRMTSPQAGVVTEMVAGGS